MKNHLLLVGIIAFILGILISQVFIVPKIVAKQETKYKQQVEILTQQLKDSEADCQITEIYNDLYCGQ